MERSFLQTQAGSLVVLKLNPDEQALVVVRPPFLCNLLSRYDSILDYEVEYEVDWAAGLLSLRPRRPCAD
jgi:hypothetical protein